MKKIFMYFTLAFAVLFGSAVVTTAQAQSKDLKKMVKKLVKEKNKQGWTMLANATTMDYALMKYHMYLEEDTENRIPITGIAVGKNVKIGRENAIMNGISSYASRAKSQVVGKMKSVMSSNAASISEEEIDKFGAAYESGVNAKLGGLVKQHFVLVKTDANGQKEFNVFMSLDESKAKKAREEAAAEAKKKVALQDLSEEVAEFIGEPVSPGE